MEKSDKREAIIRACLELVGERGFHGAPMSQIAERAGVAAGTIYRYFDSKDTLIKEVYTSLEATIFAEITRGYPAEQPVRERFLHMGRTLVAFFIASPMEFRFLEQFHNSPYGVESRRAKLFGKNRKNLIVKLFEEARDQKVVKDLPLPILIALALGPLGDISRDHVVKMITLDRRLIDMTVEACWDAIQQ